MEKKIKRPISIWIAQAHILYSTGCAIYIAFYLILMYGYVGELRNALLVATITAILIALHGTAFWGMARREPYGRWIYVALMSFTLASLLVYSHFINPVPVDPGSAQSGIVKEVIFSGLAFALILYIAFSKKVSAFFLDALP